MSAGQWHHLFIAKMNFTAVTLLGLFDTNPLEHCSLLVCAFFYGLQFIHNLC